MDELIRNILELRHPFSNEAAGWIVLDRLFDRIMNTHRIYARYTGLHLQLTIVNPRFVVREQLSQMMSCHTPIKP